MHNLGMLLLTLGRPKATFEQKDLYPDLFSKASALMDSLVRNHPFVEGNKRTAISSTAMFLRFNGYRLVVENDELIRFTLACAQSEFSLDEISDWFKRNSVLMK